LKPNGEVDQHEGTYQWEFSDPDARGRAFDWHAAKEHLHGRAPGPDHRASTCSAPTTPQLAGLLRTMAAAQEGERNSILHWAGRRLAENGYGPAAADLLASVARETGLGDLEIQRTLQSAGAIS
jgi:hypothetical protein